MVSNWCAKPGGCAVGVAANSDTRHPRRLRIPVLLNGGVFVGVFANDGDLLEIFSWRWRRDGPLQAFGLPGVGARHRSIAHRPDQINERYHVADAEDRSAGRRHHIEHLELRWIDSVAPGHAKITKHELREEGQVEADENDGRRYTRPHIRVEPPADLGPPEVNPSEVGHHC